MTKVEVGVGPDGRSLEAVVTEGPSDKPKYDLEARTAEFGEMVIQFLKTLPRNSITNPLISQLVRSATSIGANYCEADDAHTHKEFRHRIGICRKEARETKHWLRMIAAAHDDGKQRARELWIEAKELHLIFAAIIRKTAPDPPSDVD